MAEASEKGKPIVTNIHDELDHGEYIVKQDAAGSDNEAAKEAGHLKTNKDGVVLIPQPSEDPNDPLNWSWMKKHAVFASLLPGCFLTDWVITWGTTVVRQEIVFHNKIRMLTGIYSLSNKPQYGTCPSPMLQIRSLELFSCKDLVDFLLCRYASVTDVFQSFSGRNS
jgi:hypothetical protein